MNKLTQLYNNRNNEPQMLNNNPLFSSNIHDKAFYQKMMIQKEEQMRKVRNVQDLGLSQEQLTDIIIAPIKIAKNNSSELAKVYSDNQIQYSKNFIEQNLWKNRTNAPYKGILKNADTTKQIKDSKDLIVHRVTDSDKIGLLKDFNELNTFIKNHNGELRVIFSSSSEAEHLKQFTYVQKFKDIDKYNPKDYNDLKNFYNQEQKKFDREQKRIDDIISRIMDDDIDETETKRLESELYKPQSNINQLSSIQTPYVNLKQSSIQSQNTTCNQSDNQSEKPSADKRIRIKKINIESKQDTIVNIQSKQIPQEDEPKESVRRIRIVRKIQQ